MGANVHGFALDPPTQPSLFDEARVGSVMASDTRSDVRDLEALLSAVNKLKPEVIFHLAAQPLVRQSYRDPVGTLTSNVIGTAHVLEAARLVTAVQAVVVVTTDKVYSNREWVYPYREVDPLGGNDVYSGSKAAAEVVAESYRESFFRRHSDRVVKIATARSGNVIGGGDWAKDRLIPDCLRAFSNNEPIRLRYPGAVRPWQYVLDPLAGYLLLAERLLGPSGSRFATAWNFGPDVSGDATVADAAQIAARLWGDDARIESVAETQNPREAGLLRLDSTSARTELGWRTLHSLESAVKQAVIWQRAWQRGENLNAVCENQLNEYELLAQSCTNPLI